MSSDARLVTAGTSPGAIASHYDLSNEFFAAWLGPELVYSCALWDETDPADSLDAAQARKLDWFADVLEVAGGRVLDIGCGWGALLDRFVRRHGAAAGVGLTLSEAQRSYAVGRGVPAVDYRVESWVDHRPTAQYDAATCIEMSEHLASDALTVDEKVEVYDAFFGRVGSWLRDGGRFGLQLICLDNVGHADSRPGHGPTSELIRTAIFPESMPGSLGELALGWETHFQLDRFIVHPEHYARTFRAWALAARARMPSVVDLIGRDNARTFARYFAAGEALFRLRQHALYRVVLTKRPAPKTWARYLRAGSLTVPMVGGPVDLNDSASATAVRAHYDVSNEFYACWLDPTMMYSSGWWGDGAFDAPLCDALAAKIDRFAEAVGADHGARVLDVGCGWGGTLRRLVERHGVTDATGLTLSAAQQAHIAAHPIRGVDVRLEGWADHQPDASYDAIVSFGAFEHFARDGADTSARVATYRRFFARAYDWLAPNGRLGLETIAHDDAPDTASPLGRGPLGDSVLQLFPESICPHTCEVVLGFEPFFEVELLRSDPADFARTFRHWLLALRSREDQAVDLVGADTVRLWRRYLAASEAQFRMRTLTNLRVVLRRRPTIRS